MYAEIKRDCPTCSMNEIYTQMPDMRYSAVGSVLYTSRILSHMWLEEKNKQIGADLPRLSFKKSYIETDSKK